MDNLESMKWMARKVEVVAKKSLRHFVETHIDEFTDHELQAEDHHLAYAASVGYLIGLLESSMDKFLAEKPAEYRAEMNKIVRDTEIVARFPEFDANEEN